MLLYFIFRLNYEMTMDFRRFGVIKMKNQIKEILKRIKYDPNLFPEDFFITFRGTEEYETISYVEIELTKGGFYYKNNFIPYHRVVKIFSKNGKILLRRAIRVFKLKEK